MQFDFDHIRSVSFGVNLEADEGEVFRLVPCDKGVQDALKEMLVTTIAALTKEGTKIEDFSPAEKYGANERLRVELASELVQKHREVYGADNLETDTHGLDEPAKLISYFAVFQDRANRKLIAFRRAAQFKGVVKKHLVTFMNDALRIVPDGLFKLDTDFDFLILKDQILIWRPSGFIFTAGMEEQLMACAAGNVDKIAEEVTCVDFVGLRDFVSKHRLAMRLIAALKSRQDLGEISMQRLKVCCKDNGVTFTIKGGKMVPAEGTEMDFLLLLDRRLYTLTLIEEHPERYQAASRSLATRAQAQ